MLASVMHTPMISTPPLIPQLAPQSCLNADMAEHADNACSRCRDVCPAGAIQLSDTAAPLPTLDTTACTGCTACVSICPTDAMRHAAVRPAALVRQCMQLTQQGKTVITVACSATNDANHDATADITILCHAAWTPMLLASLAAEGVKKLYLDGIDRCGDCPMRFGAEIMQQTEKDYAALNQALGIHLAILRRPHKTEAIAPASDADEPERRAFFRTLIPSLAHGAARASEQITQAARLAASQQIAEADANPKAAQSLLPVRLQLFLRALPKLQSNFMPIPAMPSLPFGAIQADARCTACGECIEQCPTRALQLREFGTNKILEFRADACIGCSRCIDTCPEQALEALPGISLPAILTGKSRPLVMVACPNPTDMNKSRDEEE